MRRTKEVDRLRESGRFKPCTRRSIQNMDDPSLYFFQPNDPLSTVIQSGIYSRYEVSRNELAEFKFKHLILDEAHTARRPGGAFYQIGHLLQWESLV